MTHAWFPWDYLALAFEHSAPWVWFLVVRDLALVVRAFVLAWPERASRELLEPAPATPA